MKHQYADAAPEVDFRPTDPPPLQEDAQLAELMSILGAVTVRTVIFDLDTRLCHESWQINEYGESSNDSNVGGAITQFVTAMGTIAQLSKTPATETLIRQLNPRRVAFAWRVGERRVAVAEARYRMPQTGRQDQDALLVRELFIARMLRPTASEAVAAVALAPEVPNTPAGPAAQAGQGAEWAASPSASLLLSEKPPQDVAARPPPTGSGTRAGAGAGLFALMLFCLIAVAMFLIADQQMQSLQSEHLRLRAQAEATMSTQLTAVLAQGDYGEVQAELDAFAELGYFQNAVVTNAQRRVVALVGTVQGARIGNIFPADDSVNAKSVALRGRDQPGVGHLMTWEQPGPTVEPPTSQRTLLIAASLSSLVALVAAAWLLARFRRRNGLWPYEVVRQPDVANPSRTSS
ncbi:MAG: hypothetical protein Q8R98_21025 [Rubrivivax sp.]|nr:hypothetical protein [Rubrivivax sp.]